MISNLYQLIEYINKTNKNSHSHCNPRQGHEHCNLYNEDVNVDFWTPNSPKIIILNLCAEGMPAGRLSSTRKVVWPYGTNMSVYDLMCMIKNNHIILLFEIEGNCTLLHQLVLFWHNFQISLVVGKSSISPLHSLLQQGYAMQPQIRVTLLIVHLYAA